MASGAGMAPSKSRQDRRSSTRRIKPKPLQLGKGIFHFEIDNTVPSALQPAVTFEMNHAFEDPAKILESVSARFTERGIGKAHVDQVGSMEGDESVGAAQGGHARPTDEGSGCWPPAFSRRRPI
jgi:hypothetical protein